MILKNYIYLINNFYLSLDILIISSPILGINALSISKSFYSNTVPFSGILERLSYSSDKC